MIVGCVVVILIIECLIFIFMLYKEGCCKTKVCGYSSDYLVNGQSTYKIKQYIHIYYWIFAYYGRHHDLDRVYFCHK